MSSKPEKKVRTSKKLYFAKKGPKVKKIFLLQFFDYLS